MKAFVPIILSLALVSCQSPESDVGNNQTEARSPVPQFTIPAGEYVVDPAHMNFSFTVTHLGLSDYVMRFTGVDATVMLNPEDVSESTLSVKIDPTTIKTDYPGDYRETHASEPYASWDEDLAMNPKFLNAGEFKEITFRSTNIEKTGDATARITGDLTLLGQTHPVTMDATLTGLREAHPMTQRPVFGIRATGSFKRSEFGMTHLVGPALISDEVQFLFNGEFGPPVPAQ
tara:strand:- start:16844 stop:17536 length:693 start_codon:yes stop_codon:yes gene_type:complete